MSMLDSVVAYESKAASKRTEETLEVKVSSISSPIAGEYGPYRIIKVGNKSLLIDAEKVSNIAIFKPNGTCTLTMSTSEKYPDRVFLNAVQVQIPDGSGLFMMK